MISRKVDDAAGFLRLVPNLLGYTPTDSFLLIPMAGGRTRGAMRMDLPATGEETEQVARTAVGLVTEVPGVAAVVLVTYGEIAPKLYHRVNEALDVHGIALQDALHVGPESWCSYATSDGGDASEVTAEDIPGIVVGGSHHAPPLPEVPNEHAGLADEAPYSDPLAAALALEPLLQGSGTLSRLQLGQIACLLSTPLTRDVVLTQAASDEEIGRDALFAQLQWAAGEINEFPQELAMYLWGQAPEQPTPARLERGLDMARQVAAASPTAGAFATCAWFSWALGRSTHAGQYADQGLALDSEHGMCQIVNTMIEAAHLPSWAFMQ